MSGFSSRDDEVIGRTVEVNSNLQCSSEEELIRNCDLHSCLSWIKSKGLTKVCLQFPDALLCDSVQIALWLEKQIGSKVFILGDTSYGSCCVDEISAEHVDGDGIIHFGHACLSPTVRLPVFYVFPKSHLNVDQCITVLADHLSGNESATLILFDISCYHYSDDVRNGLSDHSGLVFGEPATESIKTRPCCDFCCLTIGKQSHSVTKLGQTYCLTGEADQIIYIGPPDSRAVYNLRISYSGPVYSYFDGTLQPVSVGKSLQRRWYLMERLRDANSIGVIVATLGVNGYLDAVKRVRSLARRRQKKCYVISVGKPNAAKLANFPEIEVYVIVACPEAVLENEKDFLQPVVSMAEAELALNETRAWSEITSSDFRDFIPGGKDFLPFPKDVPVNNGDPDVSLLSNRIRCAWPGLDDGEEASSKALHVRAKMSLDVISSGLANRTWQGLDPALGQTPIVKAVMGRSGLANSYHNELRSCTAGSVNDPNNT